MIRVFASAQFRKFLVSGGIAAGVNVGSRALYQTMVSFPLAVVLAYLTGMITAYSLARKFVFTESQRSHTEASVRFFVVNLFGIAQTTAVSIGLARYVFPAVGMTFHAEDVAHLVGVATPVFTSFVAHRSWTFAR